MVGCVQAVVGNKKIIFQFEDGKKREIRYISLLYPCFKEEVCLEIYETISDLPKK